MTAQRVSTLQRSKEELIREVLRFQLDQTGADPSGFLDALATAIELKAWEELGLPDLGSFIAAPYDDGGIGSSVENVRKLLSLSHRDEHHDAKTRRRMEKLRQAARDQLNPELADHGVNQYTGGRCNTTSTRGTSDYTIRRLKRDYPDLAEQVISGKLTANRAAIMAGFRPPTMTVRTDDPAKVSAFLAKHFEQAEISAIAEAAIALKEGRD